MSTDNAEPTTDDTEAQAAAPVTEPDPIPAPDYAQPAASVPLPANEPRPELLIGGADGNPQRCKEGQSDQGLATAGDRAPIEGNHIGDGEYGKGRHGQRDALETHERKANGECAKRCQRADDRCRQRPR